MPYDAKEDVKTFSEVVEFKDTRITVGVYSYGGREKKIQLCREAKCDDGEWRYGKLGRLTKAEAVVVIPLMIKAMEVMG